VAVYIGGANRACANTNLSASWVRSARAMGWHLVPTYVGLQASCNKFGSRINPKAAASEGRAAANDAITRAGKLGIGRGAPLYFDMEAYRSGNGTCRTGVLTFLDAWTRQLHARKYVSGVYSSAGSGARDLANTKSIARHSLAKPDSIWIGLWDGKDNVTTLPFVSSKLWAGRRRIKQYQGPHSETHGKVRINIDSDCVYGAVY
jgi:glycoside hydrolase-like protein